MKLKTKSITLQFLFPFLFLFTHASYAQITGVIIDQTTQNPIGEASVYVNNTTYGCKANQSGYFELLHFPPAPFKIIISSVGYESATFNIDKSPSTGIIITLKPKIQDLGEVVILSPEKDGWAKYGAEFTRDFIGYSPFAGECEILNKDKLEFRYDAKSFALSVSSEVPLKIRNNATGYLMTYWLDNFEKNYITHKLYFRGYVQFEELSTKKEKVRKKWAANRKSAYMGSLTHFMQSVYNNTIQQDSFELRIYKRIAAEEYGKLVPFRTDTMTAINNSLIEKAFTEFLHYQPKDLLQIAIPFGNWLKNEGSKANSFSLNEKMEDSTAAPSRRIDFSYNSEKPTEKWIQYFDDNYIPEDTVYNRIISGIKLKAADGSPAALPKRKQPQFFAYLWKEKIPLDSFVTRLPNNDVVLKFKDYIHVAYLKELEDKAYIENQFPVKRRNPEKQQSLLTLENPDGVHVLPNGNFYNSYDLTVEEYWSYEKIDKIMPLDYKPE